MTGVHGNTLFYCCFQQFEVYAECIPSAKPTPAACPASNLEIPKIRVQRSFSGRVIRHSLLIQERAPELHVQFHRTSDETIDMLKNDDLENDNLENANF
jgi:hypothetical protein